MYNINNMKTVKINYPYIKEEFNTLKAGDYVYLSGIVYTARDAAHIRFKQAIEKGEQLPIDIVNQIIYYAGPSPTPVGRTIGSIGPTTGSRMDFFTNELYDRGLIATIGKGNRSENVIEGIKRNGGVYLAAIGGCAALGSECIKSCDVIAYEDLGPESIKRLEVKDLPLIVAVDSYGNDFYKLGKEEYLKTI